jgi:hypothetical protein
MHESLAARTVPAQSARDVSMLWQMTSRGAVRGIGLGHEARWEDIAMKIVKIGTYLFLGLLGYVSLELPKTATENSMRDTQQLSCINLECATAIDLPPSSNLFL